MGSIPKFTNLVYNSNLGGSTGTKLYRNSLNNKWVVKQALTGGGYDQVVIESIANCIYRVCGIPVPNFYLDVVSNALILEYVDGALLGEIEGITTDECITIQNELSKGFIIDALIANWDVIGLNFDNIIVPSNGGPPVRVDNGGTFYFRAQGAKKSFPSTIVDEINTLRDINLNPKTAKLFSKLTDSDINNQIKESIVPNYDKILECIPIKELKDTIKGRMDFLIEQTVWTNAVSFKNTVVETPAPEYLEPVQTALKQIFLDGYNSIISNKGNTGYGELIDYLDGGLNKYGAIISGGFILKAIGAFVDDTSVDIDIYVPSKNIEAFKTFITPLFNSDTIIKEINGDSSPYLTKNGIVSVTKYAKYVPSYAEMDVVEVNRNLIPKNVVQNFDLTFCENWYNGVVYLTYPEHVKQKHGFLENHYLKLYHSGSKILKGRMNKYINRGFKISINNPVTKTAQNITNIIKNEFKTINTTLPITKRSKATKDKPVSETLQLILDSIKTKINNSPESSINITTNGYIRNIDILSLQNPDLIPFLIYIGDDSPLTRIEQKCIYYYIGSGYMYINRYLYDTSLTMFSRHYVKEIFEYIKIEYRNTPLHYNQAVERTFYYMFINLYNAIQKGVKIGGSNPFIVFRNIQREYLSKDTTRFYYMNSFISTSRVRLPAFGMIKLSFMVHPMCKYASLNTTEKEILFTPYHRCLFLREKHDIQTYLIFPTDLTIPDTFEEFNTFKLSVSTMGSPISGGRQSLKINTVPYNNRVTVKTRNLKKLNNTVKNNKSLPYTMNTVSPVSPSLNDQTDKFSAPIPTFPGKEPTEKELKIINKFKALLDLSDSMEKTISSKR